MYLELPEAIASLNGHAVHALASPVGGRTHTLWGPDAAGRYCRMGAYSDAASAVRAMRTIAGSVPAAVLAHGGLAHIKGRP